MVSTIGRPPSSPDPTPAEIAAACRRIAPFGSGHEDRKRPAWWYQRAKVRPVFMPEWAGFGESGDD